MTGWARIALAVVVAGAAVGLWAFLLAACLAQILAVLGARAGWLPRPEPEPTDRLDLPTDAD